MASRAYRGLSGPPGSRPLCLVPGCGVSRATMSAIHQHVRDAHCSERLTQPQLDAIGAQYCAICNVFVCSTNDDSARHKKVCRQRHNAAAAQAGPERAAPRPGRSRTMEFAVRRLYPWHGSSFPLAGVIDVMGYPVACGSDIACDSARIHAPSQPAREYDTTAVLFTT